MKMNNQNPYFICAPIRHTKVHRNAMNVPFVPTFIFIRATAESIYVVWSSFFVSICVCVCVALKAFRDNQTNLNKYTCIRYPSFNANVYMRSGV